MMQNSIPQRKNCLISRYRDCERDMCMCTYSHILSTSMITIQCCHIDLQIQGENGILPQIFWNVKRRGPTHQPVLLLLSHCENNVHRYEYMKGKLGFIHRFWKKYHKIWMFITKKKITYKQECWWYLNLNYIYIYIYLKLNGFHLNTEAPMVDKALLARSDRLPSEICAK